MKICKRETKREVIDESYEVCDGDYCCEKMKKHLAINTYSEGIHFDTHGGRFKLVARIVYESFDSYGCIFEDMDYCPFCGEKLQEPVIIKKKKKRRKLL